MALSADNREFLASVITRTLSGTLKDMSIPDIFKLGGALKEAFGSIERDHIILGLRNWLLTDPRAKEMLTAAFMKAGMAFETACDNAKKEKEASDGIPRSSAAE